MANRHKRPPFVRKGCRHCWS